MTQTHGDALMACAREIDAHYLLIGSFTAEGDHAHTVATLRKYFPATPGTGEADARIDAIARGMLRWQAFQEYDEVIVYAEIVAHLNKHLRSTQPEPKEKERT